MRTIPVGKVVTEALAARLARFGPGEHGVILSPAAGVPVPMLETNANLTYSQST